VIEVGEQLRAIDPAVADADGLITPVQLNSPRLNGRRDSCSCVTHQAIRNVSASCFIN
jgi:hypothetical protein